MSCILLIYSSPESDGCCQYINTLQKGLYGVKNLLDHVIF